MTVKELIEALQALPSYMQDMPVYRGDSQWEVLPVNLQPELVKPEPDFFTGDLRLPGVILK